MMAAAISAECNDKEMRFVPSAIFTGHTDLWDSLLACKSYRSYVRMRHTLRALRHVGEGLGSLL